MATGVLREEFHLTVYAPRGLPEPEYEEIRRTLDGEDFRARVRRAVYRIVRREPALSKVRVTMTR